MLDEIVAVDSASRICTQIQYNYFFWSITPLAPTRIRHICRMFSYDMPTQPGLML